MNPWERWAKRIIKMIIWMIVFFATAHALDIDSSWQVLLLVIICSFADALLDGFLPTTDK